MSASLRIHSAATSRFTSHNAHLAPNTPQPRSASLLPQQCPSRSAQSRRLHVACAAPQPPEPTAPKTGVQPAAPALSGTALLNKHWQEVTQTQYQELPKIAPMNPVVLLARSLGAQWGIDTKFRDALAEPFTTTQEVGNDRLKVFHPFGTTCTLELRPTHAAQPFGGLFAANRPLPTLARASLGAGDDSQVPGLALAIYPDVGPAKWVVACPGPDGQPGKNFTGPVFTTHPDEAKGPARLIEQRLESLFNDPRELSPQPLATVTAEGASVAPQEFPHTLHIRWSQEFPEGFTGDFREQLAKQFKPGDKLFTVYGVKADASEVAIWEGFSTSEWIASSYGDRVLRFPHTLGPNGRIPGGKCPMRS